MSPLSNSPTVAGVHAANDALVAALQRLELLDAQRGQLDALTRGRVLLGAQRKQLVRILDEAHVSCKVVRAFVASAQSAMEEHEE
jgi:hypothetical protein